MRPLLFATLAAVGLAACTADQVRQTVQDGQLVCQAGPTAVAMLDPSGAAILAKGKPKAFVDATCAIVNGIAVSPPGAALPTVTVTPPPISIPLRS